MMIGMKWRQALRAGHTLLLVMGLFVGVLGGFGVAAAQTAVRPDPLTVQLAPEAQVTVSIIVQDVADLYGAEFHLSFDPAIAQVVDADASRPGVQIQAGAWFNDGFVAINKADNAAGTVDFAVTLVNPAEPVSGSGVLATIPLAGKQEGNAVLKSRGMILATRQGREIPSQWQDGQIEVAAGSGSAQGALAGGQPAPATTVPQEGAAMPRAGNATALPFALGVAVALAAAGAIGWLLARRVGSR